MIKWLWRLLLLVAMGSAAGPAQAQDGPVLTLEEAIRLAGTRNPDVDAARALAEVARQQVRAEGASRWPVVGLDASVIRTDDPVGAFGGRLRQGRFTQVDFDPTRLNDPAALTDVTAALGASWRPLDLSRDAGIAAARELAAAADRTAEWTRRVHEFEAEVRYLEAVGARAALTAADAAVAAADANLAVAMRRLAEGMVTQAEVLQATAALEAARADQVGADRGYDDARGRLGLAVGLDPSDLPVPAASGLDDEELHVVGARTGGRADLDASASAVDAARARLGQAGRARLPKLEAFARAESHAGDAFASDGRSWTLGLQISLPLFTGFEIGAREGAARAGLRAAESAHERRVDTARTELAEARRGSVASARMAQAALSAEAAASEAARLMRRRYEEGLATTADLLSAEALAAGMASRSVQALVAERSARARVALLEDSTLDTPDLSGGFER